MAMVRASGTLMLANAKILDGIRVEYYGSLVPLSNVANISEIGRAHV